MKLTRVVPTYIGDSTTDINNYRPVSILPLPSKIFEWAVFNRLFSFLEKNKIPIVEQFGFRRDKTTTGPVIEQMKNKYENLDDGNIVISKFLDFSKAFDCMDH